MTSGVNVDPRLPPNATADNADSPSTRSEETTTTSEVSISGHNDQPAERITL